MKNLFLHFLIALTVYSVVIRTFIGSSLSRTKKVKTRKLRNKIISSRVDKIWKWRYQNIPNKFFGHGCNHKFDHYISGKSKVKISDLDELCDWLLTCKYIPDFIKHNARDHWSHPDDFEYEKTGDCEDFALWAWRRLKQMHYSAEFTVGKWLHDDGRVGTHAWVLIHRGSETVLLETTGSSKERMIKSFDKAQAEYIPFASVDTDLRTKVYMGIIHWLGVLSRKKKH